MVNGHLLLEPIHHVRSSVIMRLKVLKCWNQLFFESNYLAFKYAKHNMRSIGFHTEGVSVKMKSNNFLICHITKGVILICHITKDAILICYITKGVILICHITRM